MPLLAGVGHGSVHCNRRRGAPARNLHHHVGGYRVLLRGLCDMTGDMLVIVVHTGLAAGFAALAIIEARTSF